MADESKGALRWLKYGCFGCAGIMGFFLLLAGIVSGMAYMQAQDEEIADQTLTHEPPAVVREEDDSAPRAEPTVVGQVFLDLGYGEFHVQAADPGEPLQVDARYDQNSFELVETYEDGVSGWTYRVEFKRKGSTLLTLLRQAFGGTDPKLTVMLPVETPMDLDIRMSQGAVMIDLGGLWVRSAELAVDKGALVFDIGDPLAAPMDRLALDASMGGVQLSGLAHASPKELNIELSMGGGEIDMRGDWMQDSNIAFDVSMGGAEVRLPRDVRVVGLDSGDLDPGDPEIPRPTLVFSVTQDTRSEVKFRH